MAEPIQLPLFPDQAALTRIRPKRNQWRFYCMAVCPDLFGRALLARHWGRIGTQGRMRLDPHPDPGPALNALAQLTHASAAAATRIGPHDAAADSPLPFPPAQACHRKGKSEGAALALPPGRRAPWTRHYESAAGRHGTAHGEWRACQWRWNFPQMWRLKIPHFDVRSNRVWLWAGHGARCGQGVGPRRARHARTQAGAARGCARLRSRPPAALALRCAPWPVEAVGTKGVPTIRPRLRRVEQRAGVQEGVVSRLLGGRPRRRGGSRAELLTDFGRRASGIRSACWRKR